MNQPCSNFYKSIVWELFPHVSSEQSVRQKDAAHISLFKEAHISKASAIEALNYRHYIALIWYFNSIFQVCIIII